MPDRKGAFILCALLSLAGWAVAVIGLVVQKTSVDRSIRDSAVSAIQVQQLNGSLTNHALLLIVIACAATVPLVLVAVSAIVSNGDREATPSVEPAADAIGEVRN